MTEGYQMSQIQGHLAYQYHMVDGLSMMDNTMV
jgi:uncharacterized protein YciW